MAVSEKEIKRRLKAIREKIEKEGLKGLVVFSQVQIGYAGAVRYISNYHLTTRKEYLALPLTGEPVLIVPTLGQQFHAKSHSWISDVRSGGEAEGIVRELARALKMFKAEKEAIGIVGLNTMPFIDYQLLTKELPNAHFKDATQLMDEVRMVKSPEEIKMIQETTDIADRCYARLLEVFRAGRNEMEVMAEVDKVLIGNGVEDILILTAKGPSFPGFIDHPGSYTFKEGDHYIFSIEISGPSGYWTQIVRPLCLEKTNPRYEHMFKVGKAAVKAGTATLVPGKRIGELVNAVVGKVKDEGFKTGLWCGHGMGLDVGESPGLFQNSLVELKEGMIRSRCKIT
ncbi:MAG: aminopeptidase P family N-terminal domain-containing protein [Thermodesulfobacteriota bacterium]|nr:aminopeptidase P family N-terminal domain-containing protein [Thermodesulfobacteriota bacterium]